MIDRLFARRRGALRSVVLVAVVTAVLGQAIATAPVAAATPQAITFSLPPSGTAGTVLDLIASADSGLPVTFASDTLDTCTVAGISLSLVAQGTCTITASQAGDPDWNPAPDVQASMTVDPVGPPAPAPQAIAFTLPASGLVGATLELNGVADSGLTVTFVTSTASTCAVSGSSLNLLAAGTCTVTAAQAGNDAYQAASDVERSMAVEAVPQGVDLGRYSVNGTVRAAVSDATTGTTYLGGDFTSIGLRTGPVAVVDPPGTGDGGLRAASPEVLGTIAGVFADDRSGDPGFLIAGQLIAVNGQPVPEVPMLRMHLDGAGTHWVVDPSWTLTDVDGTCSGLATGGQWAVTPATIFGGLLTSVGNPSGLWRIDRATGHCTQLEPATSAPLSPLATCSALPYCFGQVFRMAWDAATSRLVVVYMAIVGADGSSITRTLIAVDYDAATGDRAWTTTLQGDRPAEAAYWDGSASGLAVTGGVVVVRGSFFFDPADAGGDGATESRTLALDAATGAITHRWNGLGEESLADGSTIAPASQCLANRSGTGPLFDAFAVTSQWLILHDQVASLCQYVAVGGILSGEPLGTWTVHVDADPKVPTVPFTSGGTQYLLGPWFAVALADGTVPDWHPEPATGSSNYAWATASVGGVVVAGDFTFLRGTPMPGVAALRSDMSPDPAFASPLDPARTQPDVRALALDDGWLLVGGSFFLPSVPGSPDVRSIVAVDPATGILDGWRPAEEPPNPVNAIAVDPSTAGFWIGGVSRGAWGVPAASLRHFSAPSAGATTLAAPGLTCLTAPVLPDVVGESSLCPPAGDGTTEVRSLAFDATGNLYLAGLFGWVDGRLHRGIARLTPAGTVDTWAADLLGALPIPTGSGLWFLDPHAIGVSHGRVLVGGRFCSIRPGLYGGGSGTCVSPLLVFDAASGALLRPTDTGALPWFPVFGWWTAGYGILARDSGIVVALGDVGLVVLDPVTLDYDAGASAPFLNQGWWGHDYRVGIFALAGAIVPPTLHPTALSPKIAAQVSSYATRVVLAGSIPRWGYHVAGNVAAASVASTPHLPVVTAPIARIHAGMGLSGSAIPVTLTWTGSDRGGPGIGHYELARTTDGGAHWTIVAATLASPRADLLVAASGTVRFRVRAVDVFGTIGAWVAGPSLSPRLVQQSSSAVRYRHTWYGTSSTRLSGGTARYSRSAGASATYAFTGRSVSLVSTIASTRGRARIYVNGAYVTTVDLRSVTAGYRAVVWSRTWSTSVTRTVTIVVVGTSGRPRVDVDAFAVLR